MLGDFIVVQTFMVYTYIDLHGIAYYTPKLNGTAYAVCCNTMANVCVSKNRNGMVKNTVKKTKKWYICKAFP